METHSNGESAMKQQGRCIVGNLRDVDDFTSDWMSIKIHPAIYYRRQDEFDETLGQTKGLYAELDMGQFIILRFSLKDDVTNFHRNHHACL